MKQFAQFRLGGQAWTAWLVSRAEMRGLDPTRDLEGLCVYSACRIYVRRAKALDRQRDAFLHELMHALLDSTGIGHMLETCYNGPDFAAHEEAIIRLAVPHLARLIDDLREKEKNGTI